jgi:hypothetical protein
MKNLLPFLFSMFFALSLHAQFFTEKVKVFDVKFNAKEVNGQKRFSGVEDGFYSKIRKPLIEKKESEYLNNVGTYRSNVVTSEVRNLLDLSALNQHFEHLGKIDFEFYESKGFDKVMTEYPELQNDSLYNNLILKIKTEPNLDKKKDILFSPEYRDLRLKVIASRFEINSKPFTLDKKKVSKFTAKLKAKVDTILINNNISASGDVRGYLSRLADETTSIVGIYHNVNLDNAYVGIFKDYVTGNISKIREDGKKVESKYRFAKNLLAYMKLSNSVINSSLVAIQLKGDIDKTEINITNISADLQTKFNIPAQQASSVALSVKITFEQHETIEFTNKFSSVFIVRYFSSSELNEIKKL